MLHYDDKVLYITCKDEVVYRQYVSSEFAHSILYRSTSECTQAHCPTSDACV